MDRRNWTYEETLVAFNLYCKIPFNESSRVHPLIIEYANLLGRSPSALNMKIGNLGRFDPELKSRGISGLSNGSKVEKEVWNDFMGNWEEFAYKSELIIEKLRKSTLDNISSENMENQDDCYVGYEKVRNIKSRVNQRFFRETVLSAYGISCAITNMKIEKLLVASHIVPWSIDEDNRVNPRNGICLNSIHDKAFDIGLITFTCDFKLLVSRRIKEYYANSFIEDAFRKYDGAQIRLPNKFLPAKKFIEYHNEMVFVGLWLLQRKNFTTNHELRMKLRGSIINVG